MEDPLKGARAVGRERVTEQLLEAKRFYHLKLPYAKHLGPFEKRAESGTRSSTDTSITKVVETLYTKILCETVSAVRVLGAICLSMPF